MRLFIALFLIAYLVPIIRIAISIPRQNKALEFLVDFTAVYGHLSQPGFRPRREKYQDELTALLRYYPVIESFVRYPRLSYNITDEETYLLACDLLGKMEMVINQRRFNFQERLNPLLSLQELVLLPVSTAKALGFDPGKLASTFLTVFCWGVSVLPDFLWNDLFTLITGLFK